METLLNGYTTVFSDPVDTDLEPTDVESFLSDLDLYVTGMCRGIILGAPALVAASSVGVVRTDRASFDGIANRTFDAGCSDGCNGESPINETAQVLRNEPLICHK